MSVKTDPYMENLLECGDFINSFNTSRGERANETWKDRGYEQYHRGGRRVWDQNQR